MEFIPPPVIAEVRAELGRRQIRQIDLAHATGYSPSLVCMWLTGVRPMYPPHLEVIAEALGCPRRYFHDQARRQARVVR